MVTPARQPTVGKPTGSTTGTPSNVPLRVLNSSNRPYAADVISGSRFIVNTRNAVYDGWQFNHLVEVRAPGVRFTRSHFRGVANNPADSALLAVRPERSSQGQPSAVVEDSTLIPAAPNNNIDGVRGSNFTLRRVEISKTVDGVHIHGTTARDDAAAGNVAIEQSWIHDLPHYDDSSHSDGTHNDGVQIIGGKNIRITGNRIDGIIHNAGVMITKERNDVSNVAITGNWAAGGACTINVYDKNASAIAGLSLTGNTFTRGTTRNADCAMIVTDATRALTKAADNSWEDNSGPVPVKSGG